MSSPGSPSSRPVVLALLVVVVVSGACSRDDDLSTPTVPTTTTIGTTDEAPEPSAAPQPSPPTPSTQSTSAPDRSDPDSDDTEEEAPPVSLVTTPSVSVVDVAEVGVPGLESDDAFCSSWSRFAGSFQVVAVTAAFGSGSPDQLAALEVAAAPTVTSAYEQLVDNWPEELASEADVVADEYLGPFARRLDTARGALRDVGADDSMIESIERAWLEGLAQRDPTTPEFVVDLPDELWGMIVDAAAAFAEQRVPFSQDPTLVTDAQTPLTDEYLAVSCPDQGTLSGQEVETP